MLDVQELFPGAGEVAYFNTATMALGNERGARALSDAVRRWSTGTFDWTAAEESGEDLRRVVSSLLGVGADDMAFVTGASGAASTVAAQLPPGASGANVVVPEHDFTSNFLAWQMLGDRGYEVRLVPDVDGVLSAAAFAELVDPKTAVVATSLVQSATGFKVDLDALKQIAAEHDAWLVLDASQALGCLRIDVDGVHALFSCSHKWLCGIRGMGHLYVHPDLRDSFRPLTPGWKSAADPAASFYGPSVQLSDRASKLDVSSPWFDPLVNLEGARIVSDVGVGHIETHASSLLDRLESHGVELPFAPPHRSTIVTVNVADPSGAADTLAAAGIVASVRAGKVRISVHLYNTVDHVDALVAAIS